MTCSKITSLWRRDIHVITHDGTGMEHVCGIFVRVAHTVSSLVKIVIYTNE